MSRPALSGTLPEFAPELYAAEDRHFWFRARNTIIGRAARQIVVALPPNYQVLEVGCGNGNVLRVLERECVGGTVAGMDLVEEKLGYARRRAKCPVHIGNLYELPGDRKFHLIGMFDVLEHLADDRGALRALADALVPGGRLLLTVPAHQILWSYADTHAGHFRRYSSGQLKGALTSAGLRVEYCTQFLAALFPLMWLGRRLASLHRPKGDPEGDRALFRQELRVVPVVNGLLRQILEWEAPLIARRVRIPLGTSLLAVAVKP
jgi:SAM-dependent methyltransferase